MLKRNDVETVVLLSDKRVDGHIDIDLDVEKLESKAVEPLISRLRTISKISTDTLFHPFI